MESCGKTQQRQREEWGPRLSKVIMTKRQLERKAVNVEGGGIGPPLPHSIAFVGWSWPWCSQLYWPVYTAFPALTPSFTYNQVPSLLPVGCWMPGRASYTCYLINSIKETESGEHRSLVKRRTGIWLHAPLSARLCFVYCGRCPSCSHHPLWEQGRFNHFSTLACFVLFRSTLVSFQDFKLLPIWGDMSLKHWKVL